MFFLCSLFEEVECIKELFFFMWSGALHFLCGVVCDGGETMGNGDSFPKKIYNSLFFFVHSKKIN